MNEDKNIGITDADLETVQGWQPIETAPKDGELEQLREAVEVALQVFEPYKGGPSIKQDVLIAQLRAALTPKGLQK